MRILGPLLLGAALIGCGSGGGEAAVGAAEDWLSAVADKDVAAACELMRPSAVASVAGRIVEMPGERDCARVMERYADRFDPRKMRILRDAGLEAEDETAGEGRIGVFPAARRHELEVLLMEEVEGDWKVVSVGITPVGAGVRPQ